MNIKGQKWTFVVVIFSLQTGNCVKPKGESDQNTNADRATIIGCEPILTRELSSRAV